MPTILALAFGEDPVVQNLSWGFLSATFPAYYILPPFV